MVAGFSSECHSESYPFSRSPSGYLNAKPPCIRSSPVPQRFHLLQHSPFFKIPVSPVRGLYMQSQQRLKGGWGGGLLRPSGTFFQTAGSERRFLFISGQGPYDLANGGFFRGAIGEQMRLTLTCINHILAKSGARRENVTSCRIYFRPLDRNTLGRINAIYEEFFGEHRPACKTLNIQHSHCDIEIDCIAFLP